jgi:hypothetical protein
MRRHPRYLVRAFTGVAAVLAFCAAAFDFVAGSLTCGTQGSDCALRPARDTLYTGAFRGVGAGVPVEVTVLRRYGQPVTVHTTAGGRFCFVWVEEDVLPTAELSGSGAMMVNHFRRVTSAAPPPRGCETLSAAVPWYRSHDVRSSWQFLSIILLGLGALIVLFAAHVASPPRRRWLLPIGAGAAVTSAVLCVLLWSVG